MPKRPLDDEVARAQREVEEATAAARMAEAKLRALLRAQQDLITELAEEHRSKDLHTDDVSSSVNYMNPSVQDKPKKIGRPITSKHPFIERALLLHGSIKAAAEALDVPAATVRSWYAKGEDARSIPPNMADRLSRVPWSIPKSAWKKIS